MSFPALARRLLLCAALFLLAAPFAAAATEAINLSTRLRVETGDNVGIGGFVIQGTVGKRVLIRALGPSLAAAGVAGTLVNPAIELRDATGALVASNDQWKTSQQAEIQATGRAPANDNEAAIVATLNPGAYTAIVRGADGGVGVALVEVYDLDPAAASSLINLSTRGPVRTGDNVMIGGFVVSGTGAKKMLLRVLGPSIAAAVPGTLSDPVLELRDAAGALLSSNDSWKATQQADITATGRAPGDDREPAILATLPPGAYTAIVRGAGSAQGVALVEMYDLEPATPAPAATQLYLANLRPAAGVTSTGSGTSALSLAADGLSAVVSVDYSNLTSAVTSAHIEDRNGVNLFDFAPPTRRADGTWLWTFGPVGPYSAADLVNLIRTGQVVVRVYTVNNPSGELVGGFSQASGSQSFTPPPAVPAAPTAPADDNDAVRFLAQASFGPAAADVSAVRQGTYAAWLDQQLARPVTAAMPYIDANYDTSTTNGIWVQYAFWRNAVTAPDQLRQRVAYALSQILVVSADSQGLNNNPYGVGVYYDVLANDAFANFRQLLEDVTLNPGMGLFLDMLGNNKANAATGTNPNENYAREVLQLFSIGLFKLYPDGSLQLDSRGLPIATYNQATITGFARVFTGWGYGAGTGQQRLRVPMVVNPAQHEPGDKVLLDGFTLPGTGTATAATAQADLKAALDQIFNHPNVGPFLALRLIQRLTVANPSPGYIYRVASVFNNNGSGVRGDLRAVVRAILLDYEARSTAVLGFQGAGKLREGVLRVTHLLRQTGASAPSGHYKLYLTDNQLGQTPLRAPTVFNFYTPDYIPPGAISDAGILAPEFEIATATTVINTANFLRQAITSGIGAGNDKIAVPLDPALVALANNNANIPAVVDKLSTLYCAGQLSPAARQAVIDAATAITPASDGAAKVQAALSLVATSPQFAVQR